MNLIINSKPYKLSYSPTNGSYKTYSIELEKSIYTEGENSLKIISGLTGYGNDYDDFEFSNIILRIWNR